MAGNLCRCGPSTWAAFEGRRRLGRAARPVALDVTGKRLRDLPLDLGA